MFNSNNGYSLSDIAAVTDRNNGGFFGGDGNNGWWIFLFFIFAFGGGWGGNWGWGGNNGATVTATSSSCENAINNALDINSIKEGITDGFYSLNSSNLTGFTGVTEAVNAGVRAIQSDLCNGKIADLQNTFQLSSQMDILAANQTAGVNALNNALQSNFAQLNYNLASQECDTRRAVTDGVRDIIDSSANNTRAILDFLVQDKLDTLLAENQSLKGQISQSEQNAYLINALRPAVVPAYTVPNPYAYTSNSCPYTTGCCCTGM